MVMKIIFSSVIFDMDGLMFDTEHIAQAGWVQAARECGYKFSDETFRYVVGRTLADVERISRDTFGEGFPFWDVYRRKQEYVQDHLEQHGLALKPGLLELLDALEAIPLPKAVASSSTCEIILRNLRLAGLQGRFEGLVGGDEILHGKPAPDIFLLASKKLGIPAQQCLVLEDSNAGIKAAHTAGMIAVMIPDLIPPSEETMQLAYRILSSLKQVYDLI